MQKCASDFMQFGVHTLEFTIQLNGADFNHIRNFLYNAQCRTYCKEVGNGHIYTSTLFCSIGIRIHLKQFMYTEQEFPYFSLVLVVNPRILIGDGSYLGIYESTSESNQRLIERLNICIQHLGLFEYHNVRLGDTRCCTIEEFYLSRLDLCANYKLESAMMASFYLKLFRRGNRCRFLKEATYYDSTSHRQRTYSDALLFRAGSFNISIYNKYRQMKDNVEFFKAVPEEADGLLRFEMQLYPAKLRYLLKKVPGIGLADLLSYTQDLCRMEFERYTKTLFCTGNYYTLDAACEIILAQQSATQAEKKIQFLKDVSKNKSLYQTIREYQHEGKNVRYLLDGLARLGINPVTIPARWFGKYTSLMSVPRLFGFCSTKKDFQEQEAPVY